MFNLAFHGSHNSTVSISNYDKILESVELERLLSKKNAAMFFYENPPYVELNLKFIEKYFREKYGVHEYDNIITNSVPSEFDLSKIFKYNNRISISHHQAHANSAFYQSPYNEAIVISFDGGSDEGFFNVYHAKKCKSMTKIYSGNKDYAISYMTPAHFIKDIKKEDDIYVGNLVYAGKLMGYVGFGEINYDMADKLTQYYQSNTYDNIVEAVNRFVDIFSEYGIYDWNSCFSEKDGKDIATTNQFVFEKLFVEEITPILENYQYIPIVLTGGCALNIINNTLLFKSREVFVPPNPNDVGLSIGMLCELIKPRKAVDSTYIGPPVWDYMELPRYLIERESEELDIYSIAMSIVFGSIFGVVRGRSEHGPRALGNRSIICDATNPSMKNYLNKEVKNRESFRPFAPVVRLEDVSEYFEWYKESRWMTFCPKVRDQYKDILSSIVHIDGTSRVQTVTREQNAFLYDLLTEIHNIKGCAVLLNTSFNINGKPILNTYKDAFWMLDNRNLSGLIIENYFFPKEDSNLESIYTTGIIQELI